MSCADCIIGETTAAEFLGRLRAVEARESCAPLSASMDWTQRCNLACQHCFVHFPESNNSQLPTIEVKRLLDKLTDAGVLFLVITGGEPLSRPDFRELYLHAKSAGLMLNLFTNATLIDDTMADFLATHPPRRMEVTVYGHTEATYETVTQTPGSFLRFRRGVEAILRRGLLVRLKTMVMTTNAHEFKAIQAWAAELDCDFRYDGLIHGRFTGDLSPNQYRLPPETITDLHFSNASDKAEFRKYVKGLGPALPPKQTLLECGAGTMTLHVDAAGHAHPCMMWREDPYSLLTDSLDEHWFEHVRTILRRPAPEGECRTCLDRGLCGCCPPLALIETRHPGRASPFYCQLAAERKRQCQL